MTAAQATGDQRHTRKLHPLLHRLASWHAAWNGRNATAHARNRALGIHVAYNTIAQEVGML